ncbi:MAG: RsmB/NOP family class I SAM-dependent RNA methyltransferase [Alphaproteobacteria bacterium]|nr:RsmB/NOP family class I SAM-dependent RNA methyltransferase [Alphaproteobacteria bacterium]MBU0797243.1 RsmB/NOP family class I SAM-dependent RNA methyltransferase [Alphaproteobacteria bacterium]MBU0888969.1 RsmB/NOP family class I SAM-dependent RNA methyltransferase [Alphaproteobacteria bacterium]MBU1813989.1 RsmB/NOP family class I SAM-dependent RNA methyltransferase [Alphaproteobacteria bacterium]
MTPGARITAAIEVLEIIRAGDTLAPADSVLGDYLRQRRYIGSKDRTAISSMIYGLYRHRARIGWWLDHARSKPRPRTLIIAMLLLVERMDARQLRALFDAYHYNPAVLEKPESTLVDRLEGQPINHPDMPEAVQGECPAWAEAGLRAALGERFMEELQALNQEAATDLRVNTLVGSREDAIAALAADDIFAKPSLYSPIGLRVSGRPALGGTKALTSGLIEVQDEGSQMLALLVGAEPGMQVVDFCAGAGGKTLALAAQMQNKGRIIACDVNERRLDRLALRQRRAAAHNIERRPLASERDPWVKRHKDRFERVLVDAPCTGTGTWRRNPDAKWGRGGVDLAELTALQAEILDSAARLVKPGGRLVYATCSLLAAENEDQVAGFLANHADFRLVPLTEAWRQITGTEPPADADIGGYLRLSPARHGTDGFVAAVLERAPVEAPVEAPGEK